MTGKDTSTADARSTGDGDAADRSLDRLARADLEVGAVVSSSEMRFDVVPDTEVVFWGKSPRRSVSGTERENLPDSVEPGVTYRNTTVRMRIASRIVEVEGPGADQPEPPPVERSRQMREGGPADQEPFLPPRPEPA